MTRFMAHPFSRLIPTLEERKYRKHSDGELPHTERNGRNVRDVIYEPRNCRTRNYLEAKRNAWPIVVLVAGDWIGLAT